MRWIIGDIHGMLRPLEALLRAIERHDPHRKLLFVGDYVNRGPESKAVISLLLTLKDAHFIRGNHDDVFDQVLCGKSYAGKEGDEHRELTFKWFMQHGLDKTFLSYGVGMSDLQRAVRSSTRANLDFLAEAVPTEHRKVIRELPVVLESDDLFVAHAKWDVNTATQKPPLVERLKSSEVVRYSLVWGRFRPDEVSAPKPWERTGYFGHTPVDTYLEDGSELVPVVGPKIVLLDTAAALVPHGRLTAVCHDSGEFLQADREGNVVVPR